MLRLVFNCVLLLVVCGFGVRFGLTFCLVGVVVIKLVALSVMCYCFGVALFYYVAACVLSFVGLIVIVGDG